MHDVVAEQATLREVIARLGLDLVDGETAYGEVDGSPVTMSLLGSMPLALLWAFRVRDGAGSLPPLAPELQGALAELRGTFSIEDGYAWLSLHGLGGAGSDAIEGLVRIAARELRQGGLALGPQCARCGAATGAELVHIDGRTSRLCPPCVEEMYAAKQEAERELNRGSVAHGVGLPMILALTAVGWMVFWVTVDLVFEWLAMPVIVIDQYFAMLLVALLGAVGYGLGTFLGTALRRAGVSRLSPTMVAGGGVLAATLAGELLYVAACVFRQIGVLDLGLAWGALVPFVQSYPGLWIVGKLIVIGLAAVGAMQAAAPRTVSVHL